MFHGSIKRSLLLAVLMAMVSPSILAEDASDPLAAEGIEFFETKVRPVLAEHCYECHGPEKQKAGLRLDARAALLSGGEMGPVLVPGDGAASKLVQAIRREGEIKMPPETPLDSGAIQALEEWVAMGAPWPEETDRGPITMAERITWSRDNHWSFKSVVSPPLPDGYAGQGVDYFIGERLVAAGLTALPRADKYTQLRRLSFDLTGLPPSFDDMEAFLANEDEGAYAAWVDKLLASPQFGERWGRHWLDLARYADTKGYVFQEERDFGFSHTYRDYVVRALNEDKPYDQFIKEQLAADLMTLEDQRSLAALGFQTLGRRFVGNVHDQIDDKIDVVSRGLMGVTMQCARCHDHKYDPLTQADYYALYGVFRSTTEPEEKPIIAARDPEDPDYQDFLKAKAEKEADLKAHMTKRHVDLLNDGRNKVGIYLQAGYDSLEIVDTEPFRTLARDRELLWQLVERWRTFLKEKLAAEGHDPVFTPLKAFAALTAEQFPAEAAALAKKFSENEDKTAKLNSSVAKLFEGDAPESMGVVMTGYGDLLKSVNQEWSDLLAATSQIAVHTGEAGNFPTALEGAEREALRLLLYGADSPANFPESSVWDLSDVPTQGTIRNRRNGIAKLEATHKGRPDRAMVVADTDPLFAPYVFKRGKPGNRGDEVPRRYIEIFSSEVKPFEQGSGRLELAEAITSRDNPLTARVFVNRVWMYLYEQPLVNTPSDFGLKGDAPTHPEVLDYLASHFIESGWSVKQLIREIVLSESYRRSSAPDESASAVDPENRLLWRQNRKRLVFEAMWDSMLLASGALDLSLGGHAIDITKEPLVPRRSIYSRIERQNLPNLFRTFDFASPDAHSPRRYKTTVPQQALYLLNSRFSATQARTLVAREDMQALDDVDAQIALLYQIVNQRSPGDDEAMLARDFIAAAVVDDSIVADWHYGYGVIDESGVYSEAFVPYPFFGKDAWKGGDEVPDAKLDWSMLNREGGHPGVKYAAIRRWVAPRDGVVSMSGTLSHPSDQGDGVVASILSTEGGVLWTRTVANGQKRSRVTRYSVKAGEYIDFVVHAGANQSHDSFKWAPIIRYRRDKAFPGTQLSWLAVEDFAGMAAEPLQPMEQYAQVLMLTNEFMFVD